MRKLLSLSVVALVPVFAVAATPRTAVLDVQNMTCELCSMTVKKSLERVPGVSQARIDYGSKTATVIFDGERASTAVLIKATTEAGFPSAVHK